MSLIHCIQRPTFVAMLIATACSSSSHSGAGDAGTAANGGSEQAGAAGSSSGGVMSNGGTAGNASSAGQGGFGGSHGGASGSDNSAGANAGGAGAGGQSGSGGAAGSAGSGGVRADGGKSDGYGWSGQQHPPAPITECSCNIAVDGTDQQRCVKVVNRCSAAIRFHAQGNDTPANAFAGATDLDPGACKAFQLTEFASGRLWAETGCGDGQCDPGPHTLAEFTLNGYQGLDFYDLSLVDGFNLPMSIQPVDGTFTPSAQKYNCGAPICVYNLLSDCPDQLQKKDGQGDVVVCQSACSALHQDQYCCAGAHNTPQTCPATDLSDVFKAACPDAYSYAYDDKASTYTCAGAGLAPDYDIVFCP